MVFCNKKEQSQGQISECHNPYFNRWFSAIDKKIQNKLFLYSHNPYFNRWFSAIVFAGYRGDRGTSHNPYFNRWFSAIKITMIVTKTLLNVTILILIDGFLQ